MWCKKCKFLNKFQAKHHVVKKQLPFTNNTKAGLLYSG